MPRALPLVLSELDLPLAELLASRLDGEVFGLESGFCPVDELVSPAHRAVVATFGMPARLIPEQRTAAWVWGALAKAPEHPQFCVGLAARVGHLTSTSITVREVVLDDRDLVDLSGIQVTTPLRTAIDLARFSESWTPVERTTLRALMSIGRFSAVDVMNSLQLRNKLPAKKRAIARVAGLSP